MQQIVVAATAGLLAGLGTGFAGLSAAVFIAPMLISFLGIDSFTAIGIALASDVLASGVSTITYHRHG
ncbi:MAG: sulfite exporter TauE/SafE family protein, partial [Olsenella sp.]|nr:sulfite exporter TauE/SafE family protein [Olsenella sp.]